MKFEYLLPKTRSFLFMLANAYESSGGNIEVYHNKIGPAIMEYGLAAEEYASTLVRLHYVSDTQMMIPTESGLQYQRLRRKFRELLSAIQSIFR